MRFGPKVPLAACGVVLGVLAVSMETHGGMYLPHAYGFCTTCHSHDLVGWAMRRLLRANWHITPLGAESLLLTSVGVFLGAYLAAWLAGERRSSAARHPWRNALAGVLVANFGLLAFGCPIRQVILLGYGDWLALPAVASFMVGAILGLAVLRHQAERTE